MLVIQAGVHGTLLQSVSAIEGEQSRLVPSGITFSCVNFELSKTVLELEQLLDIERIVGRHMTY